jgi:TRAP-type C4-dicarboxylate transport system permease small subunit
MQNNHVKEAKSMARFIERFDKLLDNLCVLFLIGLVLTVALQVIFRYTIHFSAPWTEEVARFLYVYLTFIGSAIVMKEGNHIVVDVLLNRLPLSIRRWVGMLIQVSILVFLIEFIVGNMQMTAINSQVTAASMIWFKMSYLYLGMNLGAILMAIYTVGNVIKAFMWKRGEVTCNSVSS